MSDAAERWRQLMRLSESEVPLDMAALTIAAHGDPALDVDGELKRLDELATLAPDASVAGISQLTFGLLGLRGDSEHYDDPRNSYLNAVLDRRLGIPISLSILLVELARRRGTRLELIGMPGHMLVRDPAAPERLIDAFSGGRLLDDQALRDLFRRVAGEESELMPEMLVTTRTWAILERMLVNLDRSFARRRDRSSITWVTSLRARIPNRPPQVRAAFAHRLAELGRIVEASDLLGELAEDPNVVTSVAERMRRQATALRARLN